MDEIDFLQCLKKIEKWFIFQIRSEFFPGYIMRREIIGSIVVTVVTSIDHITHILFVWDIMWILLN